MSDYELADLASRLITNFESHLMAKDCAPEQLILLHLLNNFHHRINTCETVCFGRATAYAGEVKFFHPDHDVLQRLRSGQDIVMPTSVEHARKMQLVAERYITDNSTKENAND